VKIQVRSAFLFNQLIQINNAKNMCDGELRLRSRTGTKAFFTTFFVERRKRRMKKLTRLWGIVLLSAGLLTACSGGNGGNSSTPPLESGTTAEQTGSPGSWTINAVGGSGGTGGNGGFWYMKTYQQKGVQIMKSGAALTAFTIPNYNPPTDLGSNGKTITIDTEVHVLNNGDPQPAIGTLYLVKGSSGLWVGTGTGTVPASLPVTGLKVNSGVTLKLDLNWDNDGNGSTDGVSVTFPNDVDIAGTITTEDLLSSGSTDTRHGAAPTARDMGALDIESGAQIFIRSTGSIITKGGNGTSTGQRGGDGGTIQLIAGNYFINQGTIDDSGGNSFDSTTNADGGHAGMMSGGSCYTIVRVIGNTGPNSGGNSGGGVFINTRKITSNGGAGANGGNTSYVKIDANSDLFNTGAITANAGTGTNGSGGAGNNFNVFSEYGSLYNSGALSQTGGNGTLGGGGGGYFAINAGNSGFSGDIVNSGAITGDGGSATASGSGSNAGSISMVAYGAIKNSGKISLNGGDSMGASQAGSGGTLTLANSVPVDFASRSQMPVRPIQVSGNIYLNGGSSQTGNGGYGGHFYVYQAESGAAVSSTGIQLLGYTSANLSGGFGTANGGLAIGDPNGSMKVVTYNDYPGNGNTAMPPGPIVNQINITARGGNSSGSGGWGGNGISMQTQGSYFGPGGMSTVANSGKLDTSGGSGGSSIGGLSGGIYFLGHDGVTNTGSLTARGGNSTDSAGGNGGEFGITLRSSLNITNSGAIDTTGGKGVSGGAASLWIGGTPFGNFVQIYAGGKVTNTGSITCAGGAGSSANGNGGGIDILSETGGTSNTGTLNIAAGSGTGTPGTAGQAWIDWVQVK
jgi:hypothetical protein